MSINFKCLPPDRMQDPLQQKILQTNFKIKTSLCTRDLQYAEVPPKYIVVFWDVPPEYGMDSTRLTVKYIREFIRNGSYTSPSSITCTIYSLLDEVRIDSIPTIRYRKTAHYSVNTGWHVNRNVYGSGPTCTLSHIISSIEIGSAGSPFAALNCDETLWSLFGNAMWLEMEVAAFEGNL